MTLDFSKSGKVTVHMSNYVKNMLHYAPDDMDEKATTPAVRHLYKINDKDSKLLSGDKKEIFVHLVMQGSTSVSEDSLIYVL